MIHAKLLIVQTNLSGMLKVEYVV